MELVTKENSVHQCYSVIYYYALYFHSNRFLLDDPGFSVHHCPLLLPGHEIGTVISALSLSLGLFGLTTLYTKGTEQLVDASARLLQLLHGVVK